MTCSGNLHVYKIPSERCQCGREPSPQDVIREYQASCADYPGVLKYVEHVRYVPPSVLVRP